VCDTLIVLRTVCHDGTLISSSHEYGCYIVVYTVLSKAAHPCRTEGFGLGSIVVPLWLRLAICVARVMSHPITPLPGIGTPAGVSAVVVGWWMASWLADGQLWAATLTAEPRPRVDVLGHACMQPACG
jgi:hypothetical protein